MREVTVLSPHRDDAVFSLACMLRKWCDGGVHVRVVNFFTQSAYAPHAITADHSAASLSALRKREDRLALRALHPAIQVHDWSFVDAPLRLGRATADVMGPTAAPVRPDDIAAISALLRRGCTIAPLGIGDHVDHRTIRDAATGTIPSHSLAFYEDLPYAVWTAEEQIQRRVAELAAKMQRAYRPVTRLSGMQICEKRRLAALYGTQITPEDAAKIAGHRERIWVPAHSVAWVSLSQKVLRS